MVEMTHFQKQLDGDLGKSKFEARLKINGFSNESTFSGVKLSIEFLSDELKPVIGEKNQFELRDISVLLAFLEVFGLWGLWRKTQNHHFFQEVPVSCEMFLIENWMKKIGLSFLEKSELQLKRNSIVSAHLVIPETRNHRTTCSTRSFSK